MYFAIEFLLELGKVLFFLFGVLQLPIRKKCIPVSGAISLCYVGMVLIIDPNNVNSIYLELVLLVGLLVGILLVEEKRSVLFGILGTTVSALVDSFVLGAFALWGKEASAVGLANNVYYLRVVAILSLLIIVLVSVLVRVFLKIKMYTILNTRNLILLIIAGFCCMLNVTSIQLMIADNVQVGKVRLIGILSGSASGVIFILLCIGFIISDALKNKYRRDYELGQRVIEEQHKYCELLVQKSEYTRGLKHDMKNHYICLAHLLEQKKYDEMENYLNNLNSKISDLDVFRDTGNYLVNAIISELDQRYFDIDINVKGMFPKEMNMENTDVCTIFFNLFTNAYECVSTLPQNIERKVFLNIDTYKNYVYVSIKNPVKEKVAIIDNKIVTSKEDALQHGFGIRNVVKCVEKIGGNIKLECDNEYFVAELVYAVA